MAKTIIQELAANAAILLALSFLYVQVYRRWDSTKLLGQALNGILFGGVAIGVMLTPLYLVPGVVFDTRSVAISVGGLFDGPVVAAITFVMASVFRVSQGGGRGPHGRAGQLLFRGPERGLFLLEATQPQGHDRDLPVRLRPSRARGHAGLRPGLAGRPDLEGAGRHRPAGHHNLPPAAVRLYGEELYNM